VSDDRGDTEVAGDTVAADPSESARSSAKIRPSRPVMQGGPDYAELIVVDPAHYVVAREIARGGMGRVLVARDRRLGRDVALKEVIADNPSLARRFEREARITARLQHPSIISVLEAGVWPSGEPFYAMRLVSGRSLEEAIEAARTFEARLALLPNVLAVADAMAYAHGQHVIHRDLKPRNIVVGEFGETVVIDWGLAKELGSSSLDSEPGASSSGGSAVGETSAGELLGTPSYMPPEQASGAAVDERADVYAIGAILYHVLGGEAAYGGGTNAEIIASLHGGPPRPIRECAPQTPDELVAIIERAMARVAADRYPTARELADDLRRFQTGQLVGAHRYSLRQLLRRWVRRHRTAIAAVAAAGVVAVSMGAYAVIRIAQQREIAVANQQRAEDLTSFMLVDLRRKLSSVGRLDVLEDVARRAAKFLDARDGSDEELYLAGLAQMVIGDVVRKRGDLVGARGEFEKGEAALARASAAQPDKLDFAIALSAARYYLVELQIDRGDLTGALALCRRVLADLEKLLPAHPDDVALLHKLQLGHSEIAGILESQGDLDGALAHYEQSLALAKPAADRDPTDLLQKDVLVAESSIGDMLRKGKHDLAGALAHYRAGLAIGERMAARDAKGVLWLRDVAVSNMEVGKVLEEKGDLDGALTSYRAALAISEKLVAVEPANQWSQGVLADAHGKIGHVALARRDFAVALAESRASHDIRAELGNKDPTNLEVRAAEADALSQLADAQIATGDVAGGIASYRAAIATGEELAKKDATNAIWAKDLDERRHKLADALAKR
jgi:tetratricopeptide (TPR) repeat protein